jgi:hypothetical protein
MQIQLFENFDMNSKACITWKKGVHIGYRTKDNFYMSLYRLSDFYVEIQYHTSFDGITSINTFNSEDQLQPYLDGVDINSLFE